MNWGRWLNQYGRFLSGERQEHKDADKIRRYVLEEVIEPARETSAATTDVLVRDVNSALQLNEAWPNICQALAGRKMQELAEVPPPQRIGAEASSATIFRFDLDPAEYWADAVLQERYGEPINRTKKIVSYQAADGRQLGLDSEASSAQIWLEGIVTPLPDGATANRYTATSPRNSNLPPRLRYGGTEAREVSLITIPNADALRSLLDTYQSQDAAFENGLKLLRARFLSHCPDFRSFAEPQSSYVDGERAYKIAAADKVTGALQEAFDDEELGRQVFVIMKEAAKDGPLVRWQTEDDLKKKYPWALSDFYRYIGRLVRSKHPIEESLEEAFKSFQELKDAGAKVLTYGEQLNILITAASMVHPQAAAPIKKKMINAAAEALGQPALFPGEHFDQENYSRFKALFDRVFGVMNNGWGWGPRDFFDVQGFLWIALNYEQPVTPPIQPANEQSVERTFSMKPTNLILYGPPGTGKTYRTALEAVKLCGGPVNYSDDEPGRAALMKRYYELVENRQIEFVTFHQNFSYEDFVEGLRPVPLESENGTAAGFQLQPEDGIFRRIAERAGKRVAVGSDEFQLDTRSVFKISLGQSNQAQWDWVYDQSLEEGYAYLGFKDVDWSDPKFADREAIFAELQARFSEEPITSQMGVVKSPDRFRNQLKVGDVVIASKGLNAFRAIGIVEGEYEYAPRPDGRYCHRRKVRWLWDDPDGVPVSEIAEKRFSLDTIYPLPKSRLNLAAIKRYVNSVEADDQAGEILPHVLIIDEINRANISKVFGELITLLEPDKRLGQANALTVRLPYSKREFGVPSNLHLIGTMNTADRSIALLDTALRRRFRFEEMAPDTSVSAFKAAEVDSGVPLTAVLTTLNKRIEYLVDRDHRIGHAFFIGCKDRADVDEVMRHKVVPLLQEYFFDDWNRLAAVLGEKKGKDGAFLTCDLIQDPTESGGEPLTSWRVRAAFAVDAYDRLLGAAVPANDEQATAEVSDLA
ncbi:DNA polymerase III delta prime subunit [Sphingomonas kaistensis]|uniref:DNA polymerase III delta prime subunit n=1 Tax=Sphingomonas kaistensis TaxID=298708 RepID=A0A7X5Y605_9SPHN|nr:DNA polymerase III delta prime subunit [Sphingomonas kaistensis]